MCFVFIRSSVFNFMILSNMLVLSDTFLLTDIFHCDVLFLTDMWSFGLIIFTEIYSVQMRCIVFQTTMGPTPEWDCG